MKTYQIHDDVASMYHGSGYALAAVLGDQIISIRYVRDVVFQAFADQLQEGSPHDQFFLRTWLETADAAPVVRELQALGDVIVGMCGSWEFVVI